MNEPMLKKLYGEDYIPQSEEVIDELLVDEILWYVQYCTNKNVEYNYKYVVRGDDNE